MFSARARAEEAHPTVLDTETRDTFKEAKRNLILPEILFTGLGFFFYVHQVFIRFAGLPHYFRQNPIEQTIIVIEKK